MGPLVGRFRVGGLFIEGEDNGYPGKLDDVTIRWICSTASDCTVLSEAALKKTKLQSSYPSNLTYYPLSSRDSVEISSLYGGGKTTPVARIQVPLDLGATGNYSYDVWVIKDLAVDLILGADFVREYGLVWNSSLEPPLRPPKEIGGKVSNKA